MSEKNVEIVRRVWAASNRRPDPDWPALNALCDPEFEMVAVTDALNRTTRLGADGFRAWLAEMEGSFESWETKIERVVPIDQERVLLAWIGTFKGKQSGASIEQRGASLFRVRDGKATQSENYTTEAEALEAAGLRE